VVWTIEKAGEACTLGGSIASSLQIKDVIGSGCCSLSNQRLHQTGASKETPVPAYWSEILQRNVDLRTPNLIARR
jgi:hypothetical protein